MINLSDLKKIHVKYSWETIYVGIDKKYFNYEVISEYALELLNSGCDDDYVIELTWNIEDSVNTLAKIINRFNLIIDSNSPEYEVEMRKLRYVYLAKLNDNITDDNMLMTKVVEFYDDHEYPEDMEDFITYMPKKSEAETKTLRELFCDFLNREMKIVRGSQYK